jgi:hypothetical protein
MVRDAWDTEEHGASVLWRGPVFSLIALGEFIVHSFVPIDYDGFAFVDRREPRQKWFRAYGGAMRPLSEVAILCHRDHVTSIYSLRAEADEIAYAARHERWHYPRCIEVLPGSYRLEVNYYSRVSADVDRDLATETVESARPSIADWTAEAGAIYQLRAVFGDATDAPGDDPGFFHAPPRSQSPGTTTYALEVSTWNVRIERVPSVDYLDEPVLQYRERWKAYEKIHR